MKTPLPFRIIPCGEWGAASPRGRIKTSPKPSRTIFHHTAGHHPNLDADAGESYAESVAYAKAIQRSHFANGWVDSGHNFLITRSGFIFEGRHRSLKAIAAGRMVVSAHCLGQNDQPGIEHEHRGKETMTPIQYEASVWLHAWICRRCGIRPVAIYPHRKFFATACPANLADAIPGIRRDVAAALRPEVSPAWWAKYLPKSKADRAKFFAALREMQRRLDG
jgi:hypothetical protein